MANQQTQLTLFASGTTETDAEISALRVVVEKLNKQLEKTHAITVRVRAFPDDVRPGVNAYPQAELNRQIGTEYDIYLGILGSRFGTPTPQAESGTEEEFEIALKRFQEEPQAVRLLFYFKRANQDPFAIDLEQLQRVMRFRDRLTGIGVLYRDFHDTSEFVQQTKNHIYNLIIDEWKDGRWIPVEKFGGAGVSDLPSSYISGPTTHPPTSGPTEVAGEHPGPPPHSVAEGLPSAGESELGFLEYVEDFLQSLEAFVNTIGKMSEHTTRFNERLSTRTTELLALQQEQGQLKHVGGSRAQQEYVSKVKKVVDASTEDLDEYAELMAGASSQYHTHSRAMLGNFRASIESGFDLLSEAKKGEIKTELMELIGVMETSLQHISEFQTITRQMPALTGKFKRARNRTATILGELIAGITFSITEAKSIVRLLGGNGV